MKAPRGFWLWLAVFYGGILAVMGAFTQVAVVAIDAEHRQAWLRQLADAGPALVYAAAILLFVCAGVLRWAFRRYPEACISLPTRRGCCLPRIRSTR
jgi:hypothetical protein